MRPSVALIVLGACLLGTGCSKSEEQATADSLSQLKITDIKEGSGAAAKAGDQLFVHYKGTLKETGEVFDENKKGEQDPFSFPLGAGQVIQGWDKGLVGMKEGGIRRLEIPSELAYGKEGAGKIPKDADLVFEIELLRVMNPEDREVVTVKTLKEGTGPAAAQGKSVTVHYSVKTLGGQLIQDTEQEKKPVTFKLGAGDLAAVGVEAGILGPPPMKVGEVREMLVPPGQGMPPGMGGAEPGYQIFVVKLVKLS